MWARGGGLTADLCRRAAAPMCSIARGAEAAAAASRASFHRLATAEMPRSSLSFATSASSTPRVPSATLRAPPLAASQGAAASAYWVAASSARASTSPQSAARADAFARASLVGTPLVSRRAFSGGYFNNSYRPPPLRRPPPASPSHDGEQMLWNIIGANTLIFAGWHAFDPRVMHANFAVSEESIYRGRVHTAVTAAFSHYDFGHYASNMIALYYFGRSIAHLMGPRYLLNLYLAGGVAASIAHVAWCRRWFSRAPSSSRANGRDHPPIRRAALGAGRWFVGVPSNTPRARRVRGGQRHRAPQRRALPVPDRLPQLLRTHADGALRRDVPRQGPVRRADGTRGIEHGTRRASRRRRRRRRGVGCDAIRSVSTGRGIGRRGGFFG